MINLSDYQLNYFAWLSSAREKELIKEGVAYAGMVRNVPKHLKGLLDTTERRQYCVITKNPDK